VRIERCHGGGDRRPARRRRVERDTGRGVHDRRSILAADPVRSLAMRHEADRMQFSFACLGACLLAVACACTRAPAPVSAASPPPPSTLAGTRWQLREIDGAAALPAPRVSLVFEAGRLGGYAGCNHYGAAWRSAGGGLRVEAPEASARGCAGAPMRQEIAYLGVLPRVQGYRLASGELQLLGAQDRVLARFAPLPRVPFDRAAVTGSRWQLPAPGDGPPAWLELGDGSLRGFAGCRGFTGSWTARDDRFAVTSLSMDATECARGPEALAREHAFLDHLSETASLRVAGDRLQLIDAGGAVLEMRRAP
jgi:heat shock protein HslJ